MTKTFRIFQVDHVAVFPHASLPCVQTDRLSRAMPICLQRLPHILKKTLFQYAGHGDNVHGLGFLLFSSYTQRRHKQYTFPFRISNESMIGNCATNYGCNLWNQLRRVFLLLTLVLSVHVSGEEAADSNKRFFYLDDPDAGPIKELGPTYEGDTDRPDLIYDDQRIRLIECE